MPNMRCMMLRPNKTLRSATAERSMLHWSQVALQDHDLFMAQANAVVKSQSNCISNSLVGDMDKAKQAL